MYNEIKSNYIKEIILSYITEFKKYELIKYNKYIQNALNINIINYKRFSGKYKKGEKNGKGSEYNSYTDELIFEGEYLNGKRNGKGKEYNDKKLIYDGEYSNGKRNGKGIEYNYCLDKKIFKFEGEFLNGKKWNGILYD